MLIDSQSIRFNPSEFDLAMDDPHVIEWLENNELCYKTRSTAHSSQLTAHNSQLTAHSSQLTTHCSLLTANCSFLTAWCQRKHAELLDLPPRRSSLSKSCVSLQVQLRGDLTQKLLT
jgi:hypothetical protein